MYVTWVVDKKESQMFFKKQNCLFMPNYIPLSQLKKLTVNLNFSLQKPQHIFFHPKMECLELVVKATIMDQSNNWVDLDNPIQTYVETIFKTECLTRANLLSSLQPFMKWRRSEVLNWLFLKGCKLSEAMRNYVACWGQENAWPKACRTKVY